MLPTYSTGTVSVAAGGTVVSAVGALWSGINAKQGDWISINGLGEVLITEVTDTTHLKIPPWQDAAQSNVPYVIYQNYVGRVVGVAAAEDVANMLERLKSVGPIYNVPADEDVPDPSYGAESQYAHKMDSGQWWVKLDGEWVASGNPVPGYGGTSTSSVTLGTGTKSFTTQPGLAYVAGSRVRAVVGTDPTKWLEGPVTSYDNTTGAMVINADAFAGTGTFAAWNFAVAGIPGSATGAVRYDIAQGLTYLQQAQARQNTGALKKNYILNGAMMLSQENGAGVGTTHLYYPADQWFITNTMTTGAFNVAQVSPASTPPAAITPAGSPNRIRCTVTGVQASPGASTCSISQKIEGVRMADMLWGTTAAKDIVALIGVRAPVAGTYIVYAYNSAVDTGITATFTIAAGEVNNDVVKQVVLAARTTGTWLRDNGIGMWFNIYLMHASQTANVFATNGNVFELFDVGLYEGNAAPPFVVPDYASELAACQRYWQKTYPYADAPGKAYGTASGGGAHSQYIWTTANYAPLPTWRLAPMMRIAPSITLFSPFTGAVGKLRDQNAAVDVAATVNTVSETSVAFVVSNISVAAANYLYGHIVANARM